MNVIEISSRENSFLKDLRRLLQDGSASVSYTHLTLPTIYSV